MRIRMIEGAGGRDKSRDLSLDLLVTCGYAGCTTYANVCACAAVLRPATVAARLAAVAWVHLIVTIVLRRSYRARSYSTMSAA